MKDLPGKLDGIIKNHEELKQCMNAEIRAVKADQRTSYIYKWNFRHDLIVSGFPASVRNENILQVAILSLSIKDIVYCSRLKSGGILVKFVSIMVKDDIMRSYLRNRNLILSQISDLDISSRVYLNNNYPQES